MNMIHRMYPIQENIHGQSVFVHAYMFQSKRPGPSVYLQSNLHGSEIAGTIILMELMKYLHVPDSFSGNITIVPCANPIAVADSSYNGIAGRWNVLNGTNWNRIFSQYTLYQDEYTQQEYFQEKIRTAGFVEEKIARTLQSISWSYDYIIDIHTTGAQSVPHLFTHTEASDIFSGLGVDTHIVWDSDNFYGAFDESHKISRGNGLFACTWEVGPHNTTDCILARERLRSLTQWIHLLSKGKLLPASPRVFLITDSFHLCAPYAGYYVWRKQPGDTIFSGEVYADVYQPWSNIVLEVRSSETVVLLGIYGIFALSSGEHIGFVVRTH